MSEYNTSPSIRLAQGHISASTILGSTSYLVSNFPVQSDSIPPHWLAYIDGGVNIGVIEQALSGNGVKQGTLSGVLSFAVLTPDMLEYLFVNIMNQKYLAPVTLYVFHPRLKEVAINCYMRWFENLADNGTQQTDAYWSNVGMQWNRGTVTGGAFSSAFSEAFG